MNESEMASFLIEFHQQVGDRALPEVHYNHYGSRGVADVVVELGDVEGSCVYELKSGYALKQATGANEIIRQFNKMSENVVKGSDRPIPHPVEHTLLFDLSPCSLRHIDENLPMYVATIRNSDQKDASKNIGLMTPTSTFPVIPFIWGAMDDLDFSNGQSWVIRNYGSFGEYMAKAHSELYDDLFFPIERISDKLPVDYPKPFSK